MTELVGILLCLYLLAWWCWENRIKPAQERRAECEQRGHQWGTPGLSTFAVNHEYTGYVRTCRHCGRQEHEKRDGGWR